MTSHGVDSLAATFDTHDVIDLTLPVAEELPCTWPGHQPFRATVWSWFADRDDIPQPVHAHTGGGYQTRSLTIDEHTGTHIDAPRHFIPPEGSGLPHAGPQGDIGVDQLPLLAATGMATVIDLTALDGTGEAGCSPRITPDHLDEWERQNGSIHGGEVVLLHTGWDCRYLPGSTGDSYGRDALVTGRGPGWPAPSPDAIIWLHDRGVRCIGTDGLSIGPADDGGPTHVAGLSRGMVFVEALTGLDRLPTRGAWFLFLPIRVVDATGAPGRALAVLPA